jgi:hypothetical protein
MMIMVCDSKSLPGTLRYCRDFKDEVRRLRCFRGDCMMHITRLLV